MNMNNRDFRIWLATHGYTAKQVAQALQLTEATLSNYARNDRYPVQFQYALIGIVASKGE